MRRSTERILVSHAGVLPRPEGLQRLFDAGPGSQPDFEAALPGAVADVLSVPAGCYSVEAANPRHEHEWAVWEDVKLPDGATLMPGVVGHSSDIIEHPELVAQRLARYASLVGAGNVIAGTDCGLGGRVSHPEIVWAKLEDLAAGARLASGRSLSRSCPLSAADKGFAVAARLYEV